MTLTLPPDPCGAKGCLSGKKMIPAPPVGTAAEVRISDRPILSAASHQSADRIAQERPRHGNRPR
jgi:hypothetical protein